jgi:feruloyl esterase
VDPAAPNILFRVALPTSWNQKALMYGGGGFDGSIPNVTGNVPSGATDKPLPVTRGYAVFAAIPVTRPAREARWTALSA